MIIIVHSDILLLRSVSRILLFQSERAFYGAGSLSSTTPPCMSVAIGQYPFLLEFVQFPGVLGKVPCFLVQTRLLAHWPIVRLLVNTLNLRPENWCRLEKLHIIYVIAVIIATLIHYRCHHQYRHYLLRMAVLIVVIFIALI